MSSRLSFALILIALLVLSACASSRRPFTGWHMRCYSERDSSNLVYDGLLQKAWLERWGYIHGVDRYGKHIHLKADCSILGRVTG